MSKGPAAIVFTDEVIRGPDLDQLITDILPRKPTETNSHEQLDIPMINRVLALTLVFLLACLSGARGAEAVVLDEAFWEDRTANAPFSEARQAPYQAHDGTIARGYTSSAIWLRLRIADQPSREPLAITVRPAFLQRIELYDPVLMAAAGAVAPLVSGRDAGIEANNHIGFENGFVVSGSPSPRDIYLRITTNTTLTADVDVLPLGEADRRSQMLIGIISLYSAVLLVFCLWALVNLAIRRDVIYGLFALRQIYSAMHLFVFYGLLRYFFADQLSAAARDLLYCLITVTIVVTGLFDARLLSDLGASRKLLKTYVATLCGSILCVVLVVAGHTREALHLNSFIVNAAMLLLLLLALSTHNREKKPYGDLAVWIIRAGFLLMTASVSIPVLMYLNIIGSSVPMLNVLFAHAIISSIILFSVLSIRARQNDALTQMSLVQYAIKSRELQQEQARRLEKERFLSMLTHELRNPLTVIRLLTDRRSSDGGAVEKAAIDMAKVIERVEQSEKLEQSAAEILHSPVNLKDVLEDLAGANDIRGRLDLRLASGLTVNSDETLITRILANLIDNAVKYGFPSSPVTVEASHETRNERAGVALSVSNESGEAGLPNEERLFSKYYRGQGAQRQPGSGLGLYLVKGWVEMLGGSIAYKRGTSTSGSSLATFILWIPQ